MNIYTNSTPHTYYGKNGTFNVLGNANRLKLQNCNGEINITGNENTFNIIDSLLAININGNKNIINLYQTNVKVNMDGNHNKINNNAHSQINVKSNTGKHNILPDTEKNIQQKQKKTNKNCSQSTTSIIPSKTIPSQSYSLNKQDDFSYHSNYNSRNQFPNKSIHFQQQQFKPQKQFPQQNSFQGKKVTKWEKGLQNAKEFLNNLFKITQEVNNTRSLNHPQWGYNNEQSKTKLIKKGEQEQIKYQKKPNISDKYSSSNTDKLKSSQQFAQSSQIYKQVPILQNLQNYLQDREYNLVRGLTSFEIRRLKTSKYTGHDQQCSICLGQIQSQNLIITLPCAHYFHQYCIIPWLDQTALCPMCKLNILKALEIKD